ncbi:MAG: HEPN domain-containing protein [Candidatus Diapherotrites archaeon]
MNSENKSSKWERIELDSDLVENALNLSERDLKTAKAMFKANDFDWSYSVAYNSMLQAGRALMFSEGFRPKGEHKHVSVVEFVKKKFGKDFAEKILFLFNKIRKKRHLAVYEQVNAISQEEAETALNTAEEFLGKVKEIIEK